MSTEAKDVTRTSRLHLFAQEYRKTATIRAVRLNFAFEIHTKEGVMRGNAGDFLAIGPGDSDESPHRWPIAADVFLESYVPVTTTPTEEKV
jgi:hypothetical protein